VRLLVGFDGSAQGEDALELARVLGSQDETTALVVTVMPYDPLPITFAELERDAAAEAEPLFERARDRLAGVEVETRAFGGGSPSGIITDLAEAEEIDTIVIGSSHRGTVGRALLGGVGRGLLNGAPVPVAVAPRGYAEQGHGPFATIAVAFDGTPESKQALSRARELAEAHRARVLVLTVVAPPVALPGVVGYTPVNPPDPQGVLEAGVGAIESKVAVEGRELSGPPASTLAEDCESGVDLLVAGSRGYGPVTRVLLGSVTAKLIDMSPCPVLVVPRP
jgi:nucleotide-binding universal stress UspA family protein